MTELFLNVFDMSIIASYVAIAVIVVRFLLKKAPKIYSYGLWFIVLFRLVCPFAFTSNFSLFNILDTQSFFNSSVILDTRSLLNSTVLIDSQDNGVTRITENNKALSQLSTDNNNNKINNNNNLNNIANAKFVNQLLEIITYIWIAVILLLLIYSLVSYRMIFKKVRHATLIHDNIFETDRIVTPFVLGFLHPRIYIPTHITSDELPYVLKHEQTHIKRLDYLIKPFVFLTVILHWFNPLIWLCYSLFTRDMEMSCDESVMKNANEDIRGCYSKSLLTLTAKRSGFAYPIAFGENNIRTRIKNVLNYKKPTFWISFIAFIVVIITGLSFISNTTQNGTSPLNVYMGENKSHTVLNKDSNKLAIYVWKNKELTGNDDTYYSLFLVNDIQVENSEIFDLNIAVNTIDKMNKIIAGYKDVTTITLYQMNLTDVSKTEMQEISNKIEAPFKNGIITIGLWKNALDNATTEELYSSIEKNLNEIVYYPSTSSNPYDYIDAKSEAYKSILAEGDSALEYLLLQFDKGKAGGLRGQIIMILCKELLGDRNNVIDTTLLPYEWYMKLTIPKELFSN